MAISKRVLKSSPAAKPKRYTQTMTRLNKKINFTIPKKQGMFSRTIKK